MPNGIGYGFQGLAQGIQSGVGLKLRMGEAEQRRQMNDLALQQATRQTTMQENSALMARFPEAFKAVTMGDKSFALQRLNEGIVDGPAYVDTSIDPATGDWNLVGKDGTVQKIPFSSIAPFLPEVNALMRSSGYRKQGLGDYDAGTAIQDIGQYFNVEPVSRDNPDGITATQKKAVISGISRGLSYGEIGKSLGLKRVGTDDVETANAELSTEREKLNRLQRRATFGALGHGRGWGSGISEREKKGISDAEAIVAEAERKLAAAQTQQGQDLSGITFGRGAVQPQGQTMSGPLGISSNLLQQGPRVGQQAGGDTPSMGSYDTNQDGKVDEGDKAYVLAKRVVELMDSDDPAIVSQLRQRYGEAQLAEFNAVIKAFEKKKQSEADQRFGIGTSRRR